MKAIKLTQLKQGEEAVVDKWVESKNLPLSEIQKLRAMGICPQSKIKFCRDGKCMFCKTRGPCIIGIQNTRIAISEETENQLLVKPTK
jgi:Fe2+ transport system protein FeoA